MAVFKQILAGLILFFLCFQSGQLYGQSQPGLLEQFSEIKENYRLKNYDESISVLEDLQPTLCESDLYEVCIESVLIMANIYRNLGEEILFKEQIEFGLQKISERHLEHHPLHPEFYIQLSIYESFEANIEATIEHEKKAESLINKHNIRGITKARLFVLKGDNIDAQGDYRSAIEYYTKALSIVSNMKRTIEVINILSKVHNNMGISYRKLGEIDSAMDHYQINLNLVKNNFGDNHGQLFFVYNSLGGIYYTLGDYGTAGDYFLQAAGIVKKNMGMSHQFYAGALNNAGASYFSMNNIDKALELFEEAQRIKEQMFGYEHPETAVGYANLSALYMQNGNAEAALNNARLSIDVRRNIYGDVHPDLVSPITQYGDLLVVIGELEQARVQFREAASIAEAAIGSNHPDIWEITIKTGSSYAKENRLIEAKEYYSDAIFSMTELPPDKLPSGLDLVNLSHPFLFLDALRSLAETKLRIYEESHQLSSLTEAFELFEKASETIDYLQFQYKSEASKLNLIDNNYTVYSNAIKTAYYLLKQTNNARWIDEIIRFSELSRSRLALELIREAEAKQFAGVPENILEQEAELNQKIAHQYQKLATEQSKGDAASSELLSQHRDSLFTLKQRLEEYTQLLEGRFPVYHELKFSRKLVDREQAQRMLSENQTILKYIKGSDFWLALVINRAKIDVEFIETPVDIKSSVELLKKSTLNGEKDTFSTQSRQLFSILFEPVTDHIKTESVIIIPDESLYYLPFEMLLTEEPGPGVYYNQYPFLLHRYHISYAPSITVLNYMSGERNRDPQNLLALAPFNQSLDERSAELFTERTVSKLTPLPLTDYETREISGLFSEKKSLLDYIFPETADVLLHRDASKVNFLNRDLEQYGFLHFATHAFINENNPNLSGIALWGEEESGILYVNDIYNMRFDADLAVLGACETGLGTLYRGEGVIGFTRAFIYAGVSNLTVSMWRVNDQPTSRLMISFYRKIREGTAYSEALRAAKLELIEYPEFSEPKNWAAFVLHGF